MKPPHRRRKTRETKIRDWSNPSEKKKEKDWKGEEDEIGKISIEGLLRRASTVVPFDGGGDALLTPMGGGKEEETRAHCEFIKKLRYDPFHFSPFLTNS